MNKDISSADKNDIGNPRTQTLVLMLAIAVLTLVAVWAVPKFVGPPTGEGSSGAIQRPDELEPVSPVPKFTAPGSYAREKIRAYRQGGEDSSPEEAYQEGARQLARGRSVDAYLLYFYAARHGHPKAALALGTQADPAYHDPILGFIDRPDVTQAVKWYRMAASAGNATAEERLANLRALVERQAAAGDEQARRLTLLWR